MDARSARGADGDPGWADEISLGELMTRVLAFYRRFARVLLLPALLCAVVLCVLVAFHPLHPVLAVLDTPALTLDEWRRLRPSLADRDVVEASLATAGAQERPFIGTQFARTSFWEQNVNFRAALNRDDLRETPTADFKNAKTLGLEVTLSAASDAAASLRLKAIAVHLRHALLLNVLNAYYQTLRQDIAQQRPDLQVKLIQAQFSIEQNQKRMAQMRKLLDTYPELRHQDTNTVVSVENGGGRYLSPLAQIVALSVSNADAQAEIDAANRALRKLDYLQGFVVAVSPDVSSIHDGEALLGSFVAHGRTVFGGLDDQDPVVQEVRHELDQQLEGARLRAEQWRYKSLPALPARLVRARQPWLVAAVVFVAVAAILSILLKLYITLRALGLGANTPWSAARDPWCRCLPRRLREWFFPHEVS